MNDEQRLTVLSSDGALGVDLGSLTVIRDLTERLRHITSDQIAVSNRRFEPVPKKKCKVVGNITDTSTMALHALWRTLDAESELEEAKAGMAVDEHIETDHRERHALLVALAGVAKEMWWAQVKLDLGFHKCVGIGIYKDWTIVEIKRPNGGMSGFVEMIGGSLPIPGGDSSDDE